MDDKATPEGLARAETEMEIEANASKITHENPAKHDISLRNGRQDDHPVPPYRRNSRANANANTPSISSRPRSGTVTEMPKDVAVNSKKRADNIDWWAFEYALIVGKRWRKIVRTNKEERIKFALQNTRIGWNLKKYDDYEAFKRTRQGNGSSRDQLNNAELGSASAAESHKETAEKQTATAENKIETAETQTKRAKRSSSRLSEQQEVIKDVLSSQIPRIRPCWSRMKAPTQPVTQTEGKNYYTQYVENLRNRLGKDGCYSYKLLGECYIHGMMDGEAMSYQNKGNEGEEKVVHSNVFEIR